MEFYTLDVYKTTESLVIKGFSANQNLLRHNLGFQNCIKDGKNIDPPYNTGNDFIYKDKFVQDEDEYLEESGQVDEEGNRLFQNREYRGRYHSDWLTMMYPRLKLARNLLSEDGVIFISIDDNEVHNLRKICDEIFGERNFVANIIWEKNYAPKNNNKYLSENHDHIILYAKSKDDFHRNLLPMTEKQRKRYVNLDNDPRGDWKPGDFSVPNGKYKYPIELPSGRVVKPPAGRGWSVSKRRYLNLLKDNRIYFGKDGNAVPATKRFLSETQEGLVPMTIWKYKDVGHTQSAKQKLIKIFDNKAVFDTPKSVDLLYRILYISTDKNSIILDFFSGSATTAHAVMDLNAEDGGNRKYIMVQLPEPTDEKSEAYKAGYKNIAEIGKERIRRAGKKIKEETGADIDYGFRVYRVDSSNMKDVFYGPDEIEQDMLERLESNIKEDRTGLDLLTQVMLELGLELSLPIKSKEIQGKEVYFVAENSLVACFEEGVNEELIKEIARTKPLKVVFRDSSFKSCPDKINLEQIFKSISPNTEIRVL